MEIIYTFVNKIFKYDCKKCGGLCCNLNSTLLFNKNQIGSIKDLSFLKEYIENKGEKFKVYCGKRCWFLENNKCVLSDFQKPLGCILYPVNIWKISNDIIIAEIIPCPRLKITENTGIEYVKLNNNIMQFEAQFGIGRNFFYDKLVPVSNFSLEDNINKYKVWKEKYLEQVIKVDYNEKEKIIRLLFTQIMINPIVFFSRLSYTECLTKYLYVFEKVKSSMFSNNLNNLYIIIRNTVLKCVLYEYYVPCNKNIYNRLTVDEKNFYIKCYYNSNNIESKGKEKIFNQFYNCKDTIWRGI